MIRVGWVWTSGALVNQVLWWLTMQPPFYNIYDAITLSDTVDFPRGACAALFVGGAGLVVAVPEDGKTAVSFAAAAGAILPIKARRVNATGTTATLLIALYQR